MAVGAGVLVAVAIAALAVLLWPRAATAPGQSPRAYARIPRIDVHVHVAASRADEARAIFARYGVRLALNANGGDPHPGLLPYCHVDFGRVEEAGFTEHVRTTLERCQRRGGVGLKIFKSLGLGTRLSDGTLLRVDDPRLDVVFDTAGRLGLPVLIHTVDPQAFFRPPTRDNERYDELAAHPNWSFYGEGWPSWEEVFSEYEQRVARSAGTTFVGAHFGNDPEEPERVAAMLARSPNLYVDTAARIPELGRADPHRVHDLFVRFHDRILFGTDVQLGRSGGYVLGSSGARPDPPERIPVFYERHFRYFETADRGFPHPTPIQGDWTIDGIDLPRDVLEDLYHRNAERVFGVSLPAAR